MTHSNNYEKVKRFYLTNMWSVSRVRDAVAKNWISEEEFEEITGEVYNPE